MFKVISIHVILVGIVLLLAQKYSQGIENILYLGIFATGFMVKTAMTGHLLTNRKAGQIVVVSLTTVEAIGLTWLIKYTDIFSTFMRDQQTAAFSFYALLAGILFAIPAYYAVAKRRKEENTQIDLGIS